MKSNPFFLLTILIFLSLTLFTGCENESVNDELNLLEDENYTEIYKIDKEDYEVPPNG